MTTSADESREGAHRPDPPGSDVVDLVAWTGPIPDDHPDANFLVDVATWSLADPMATLRRLSDSVGVPVGALARYVLARWVTAGSDSLLEVGPTAVERMRAAVDQAERADTDAARLVAYRAIAEQLAWLGHGLDDPIGTYPEGGADPAP
ncbi:DUF6027 family protein [Salsipaludibacter albus]|uniref:DUF6027 family protein n=1 Tax=Salsipaludibacter albus TaxID=2849650 RepID=UPI001EE3C3A9|nr:hypothetical protein [Salsipaludibacter albus]